MATGTGRERKLATLLYADLVGSACLTGGQDPELVAAIVTNTFDCLSREVRRYQAATDQSRATLEMQSGQP